MLVLWCHTCLRCECDKHILNESQNEICKSIFEDENSAEQTMKFIRNHPNLSSYCFVPVNLILVADCVNKLQFQERAFIVKLPPASMSSVLSVTLTNFLSHKTNRRKSKKLETKELSKLFWEGFSINKHIFQEDDLKKLSETTISTFLISFEEKESLLFCETRDSSYFAHRIIQEYLSAIYILHFLSLLEFLSTFIPELGEAKYDLIADKLEVILSFLFGLSNQKTSEFLKKEIVSCQFPKKS